MDLIEKPVLDFKIKEICLLSIIFTLKRDNLNLFKNFMSSHFSKKMNSINNNLNYDAEISSIALNLNFFDDIKKMQPFGAGNPIPTFLIKDLKVIKSTVLNRKHISSILKSKIGFSINSISFNSMNSKIGEHLLNYKKNLNVLGQINENIWNNKKTLQLTIRDLIL